MDYGDKGILLSVIVNFYEDVLKRDTSRWSRTVIKVWGVPIQSSQHHISEIQLNDMRLEGDNLADAAIEAFFERYPQLLTCQADGFVTALKLETKIYKNQPGYEEEKKNQDIRIAKFIDSVLTVPDWLDYDLLVEEASLPSWLIPRAR